MVPVLSLVFMVLTLLICLALPIGGMLVLFRRRLPDGTRRHPGIWRAFGVGALAFFLSQVLIRLPLLNFVVPGLPEPARGVLLHPASLSFSAGLFEETARLVLMVLLLKGFHRFVDGVAFGLGHGGLEAVLLVGMTQVANLSLALLVNSGGWDSVAGTMPPEAADALHAQLVDASPWLFLMAGLERIFAVVLHIGCSLIVLWGVHRGRRLLAWAAAVLLHGATNWVAVETLTRFSPWAAEAALAVVAVLIVLVATRTRGAFPPTLTPPAVRAAAPAPDTR